VKVMTNVWMPLYIFQNELKFQCYLGLSKKTWPISFFFKVVKFKFGTMHGCAPLCLSFQHFIFIFEISIHANYFFTLKGEK